MAAGREEEYASRYYIEDHPAMFRLLVQICRAAKGRQIEICGELAGNTKATPFLLGMGIRHLSVLPLRVPYIKETVRNVEIAKEEWM